MAERQSEEILPKIGVVLGILVFLVNFVAMWTDKTAGDIIVFNALATGSLIGLCLDKIYSENGKQRRRYDPDTATVEAVHPEKTCRIL